MTALIENLARHACDQPDTVALRSANTIISYRDLFDTATAIAGSLSTAGIQRLGLLGANSIDWVLADIGARIANITLVPLPTFFSRAQLEHVVNTAALDAILIDDSPHLPFAPNSDCIRIGNLRLTHCSNTANASQTTDIAKITFTSGSTGTPKGVLLTAQAMDAVASALKVALEPEHLQNHICVLPFSTLLENIAGIYVPLLRGSTVTVLPPEEVGLFGSSSFDASMLLRAIDTHDADSMILTPQLLKSFVQVLQQGTQRPDRLRFVAVGGGHVAAGLLRQARALGLPVYEGYGLSECGSVVSLNTPSQNRNGSCGKPLVDVDASIRNGEIVVSGRACAYLGDELAAPDTIATGDLGHIDDDGFLFITGRRKNLLITSYGRNVSPEWIESELQENQTIAQCMVFGDDRPHLGALVYAAPAVGEKQLAEAIAATNLRLPDYARINVWHRLSQPFSMAAGFLTENQRLKRGAITTHFQCAIDALYATSALLTTHANNQGDIHVVL